MVAYVIADIEITDPAGHASHRKFPANLGHHLLRRRV